MHYPLFKILFLPLFFGKTVVSGAVYEVAAAFLGIWI